LILLVLVLVHVNQIYLKVFGLSIGTFYDVHWSGSRFPNSQLTLATPRHQVMRLRQQVTRLRQQVTRLRHQVTRLRQQVMRLRHQVTRLGHQITIRDLDIK